jgi:hypothetical protein
MTRRVAATLIACLLVGCGPVRRAAPPAIRVGYLATSIEQHPTVAEGGAAEAYLDLHDALGKRLKQIVLVFPPDAVQPQDQDRPVEVTGRVQTLDLGGPAGTKDSYANEFVFVESWRYVDPRDVPRQPARDGDVDDPERPAAAGGQ